MRVNANAVLRSWTLLATFGGSYAPGIIRSILLSIIIPPYGVYRVYTRHLLITSEGMHNKTHYDGILNIL